MTNQELSQIFKAPYLIKTNHNEKTYDDLNFFHKKANYQVNKDNAEKLYKNNTNLMLKFMLAVLSPLFLFYTASAGVKLGHYIDDGINQIVIVDFELQKEQSSLGK